MPLLSWGFPVLLTSHWAGNECKESVLELHINTYLNLSFKWNSTAFYHRLFLRSQPISLITIESNRVMQIQEYLNQIVQINFKVLLSVKWCQKRVCGTWIQTESFSHGVRNLWQWNPDLFERCCINVIKISSPKLALHLTMWWSSIVLVQWYVCLHFAVMPLLVLEHVVVSVYRRRESSC